MSATRQINLKTHRFTFSEVLVHRISHFSKLHQYDNRHDFKDAWTNWIEETDMSELLSSETSRLHNSGFQGDIKQKLFKSCRYYYRTKPNIQTEQLPRKQYECIHKNTLLLMDQFIRCQIGEFSGKKGDAGSIAPADSFNDFCAMNQSVIVSYLKEHQSPMQTNAETGQKQYSTSQVRLVMGKFKKTYKNRFYMIRVSLQNSPPPVS